MEEKQSVVSDDVKIEIVHCIRDILIRLIESVFNYEEHKNGEQHRQEVRDEIIRQKGI